MSSRDFIMKIGGAVDPSLKKAFGSSSKEMQKLSDEMKKMKGQEKHFKSLTKTSLKLENQFESGRAEYKRQQSELIATSAKVNQLRKGLESTQRPTKAMINEFKKAKKAEDELKNSTQKQKQALAEKMREMKRAKEETAKYSKEQDNLSKQMKKVRDEQEKIKQYEGLKRNVSNNAGGVFGRASAQAVTIGMAVKMSIDEEEAFSDVRKYVDLEEAGIDMKTFKKELDTATKDIPRFNAEMYKIAAAAGNAGIATKEVIDFTKDTAKVSVAFDMDAQGAGETLATWRTAFKMNRDEMMVLANQTNQIGKENKVKAPQVAEVITTVGSLGDITGFTQAQVAALGGSLIAMGVKDASTASTGIRKLFTTLGAGESATKGQADAFKKIGLDAKQLSMDVQKDSNKAMMSVLNGIKGLEEYEQISVMKSLFGEEALTPMGMLVKNTDVLSKNLDIISDKKKYAGSIDDEYSIKLDTTNTSLVLLGKSLAGSAKTFGNVFLPVVNTGANTIGGFADKVSAFSDEWPRLTQGLAFGAAGFVGLKLGVSGTVLGLKSLGKTKEDLEFLRDTGKLVKEWKQWGPIMTKTKTGMKALGTVSKTTFVSTKAEMVKMAVGMKAMLFNPFTGWLVAGVAAVALGYYVYKNWDSISGWFKTKATETKESFLASWNGIKKGFGTTVGYIKQGAAVVGEALLYGLLPGYAIYKNLDKIKEGFTDTFDFIGNKIDGLKEKWEQFNIIGKAKNWTKEKWDKFKGHGGVPAYGKGGVVDKPHLAIVGDSSESIIPHDGSSRSEGLWFDAGHRMGMFAGGGIPSLATKAQSSISNTSSNIKNDISITFAPVIQSSENVLEQIKKELPQLSKLIEEQIEKALLKSQKNERRMSFG